MLTSSQGGQEMFYGIVAANSWKTIAGDLDAIHKCDTTSAFTRCRAPYLRLGRDARAARTSLTALPVPACLSEVHEYDVLALDDLAGASDLYVQAIDSQNVDLIDQGTRKMTDGTSYMKKSGDSLSVADCPW